MSGFETIVNAVGGFSIMMAAQYVIFWLLGIHAEHSQQFGIGFFMFFVSIIRSYLVRRLFEWFRREGVDTWSGMFRLLASWMKSSFASTSHGGAK